MKRIIFIFLAFVVVLLAQNATESPGRVEHKMRLTDRMIDELSATIGSDSPQQAQQFFQQAQLLQQQAWQVFEDGNIVQAYQLTKQARQMLQKAKSSMSRKPSAEENRVMRLLEQNHQLTEKINSRLGSASDREIRDLFESALQLNANAEQLLNKGEISTAGKMAQQAQSMLKKILVQTTTSSNQDKVAQALDKTDEIIALISDDINDSSKEQAIGIIGISRDIQQRAREAYENGDTRRAAQLTLSARKKAQQAKNILGRSETDQAETVSKQIRRTMNALNELEPAKKQSDATMMSRARDMLSEASAALEKGDVKTASGLASSARKIVAKLVSQLEQAPSRESVEKALSITEKSIDRATPSSEAGQELLEQAKSLQKQAQDALERGDYSNSLKKTRIARELADKAKNATK